MSLMQFAIRCLIATICLTFVLMCFADIIEKPKYQFLDKDTRVNLYTGVREDFSNYDWTWRKK